MVIDSGLRDACQYVPVLTAEYSELVRAKRDADCLKAILLDAAKHYGGLKHETVETLCIMLGLVEKEAQDNE